MLANIQGLVTPAILSSVIGPSGEPEYAVKKGFGATIPAITAMIANRSDDRGFMTQLADLATRTAADPEAITSATALAASASGTNATTEGWLSSLFGNNLSGLAGSVARYAGIRGSTATSLLSVSAPLVLTYLGRWMQRDNLGATELAEQLRVQRSQLAASLPPGFEVPASIRATAPVATYVAPKPEATSLSVPALILLGVLGLGGLLWWGVRQYHHEAQTSIGAGMSTLVGTSGTTSVMVTRELPGNVTLKFAPGGIEDVLSVYLASPVRGRSSFEFDRVGFETESATLTPQSLEQLRNVAAILIAYPKANVTVAGHTDNRGDEVANRAFGRSRAESVVAVLTEAGVPPGRMRAEGFGSQKPIASNMTEAGRSQNRRVMLDVMVK
jgi:outer membrane protein OmpA-like peptidoglycan-associated protein